MEVKDSKKNKHTAGSQIVGFDFQFYFFVYSLLQLNIGEEIGFEILDDVHIKENDKTTFYQLKHSVLRLKNEKVKNLSTVDIDLWKTINIWTEKIKTLETELISDNYFVLFTNKSDKGNDFIIALNKFKTDDNIIKFKNSVGNIKTSSPHIKEFITNFLKLDNEKLKSFISNITIETEKDSIEENIIQVLSTKNYQSRERNEQLLLLLLGNIYHLKFKQLKKGAEFIIGFEEFQKIAKRIFDFGLSNSRLPKISYRFEEKDFRDFLFIKQLEDIKLYRIEDKERKVQLITKFFSYNNSLSAWQRERYIVQTDIDELEKNVISKWDNHFQSFYGKLHLKKIKESKRLKTAHDIHSEITKEEFNFFGYDKFSVDISNGLVYSLSERLKIGWVENWEKIYKI